MIVAGFRSGDDLARAVVRLRNAGIAVETHTPLSPPKAAEPISRAAGWLPLLILLAGVTVAAGGFLLQCYGFMVSYPLDIGGRPNFFWTSYAVNAFEGGVLAAVATGFFGFLIANRLPWLYDPVDECDALREATRDGWFVAIPAEDGEKAKHARRVLDEAAPVLVEEVP